MRCSIMNLCLFMSVSEEGRTLGCCQDTFKDPDIESYLGSTCLDHALRSRISRASPRSNHGRCLTPGNFGIKTP